MSNSTLNKLIGAALMAAGIVGLAKGWEYFGWIFVAGLLFF